MFKTIFIENRVAENPETQRILAAFPKVETRHIANIRDIFEKVRKPYLQKRTDLNLFIGKKDGQLVKEAPDAYGLSGDPHYYFIHAYNCIYECEYCYLQGYFQSPDLVLFVNHDEIIAEMERVATQHSPGNTVWFHAGEFSDSLALAHITGEWPQYWDFLKKHSHAKMELRTKSVNIKPILALEPLKNVVITFSLSPKEVTKTYDRKTPSFAARIKAMKKLADAGFQLGVHFDPIIYEKDFEREYQTLIVDMLRAVPEAQIEYISLGVVRFAKDVFHEVMKNYPQSGLLAGEFIKSFDNKVRYNRPQRLYILKSVRRLCLDAGISPEKVYLCMENETD